MPTLHTILCKQFGYRSADFGSADGAVWIDSRRGTIRPAVSTDSAVTIPISKIFQVGDEITIIPNPDSSNKARFTILSINEDGFSALFANGSAGFSSLGDSFLRHIKSFDRRNRSTYFRNQERCGRRHR